MQTHRREATCPSLTAVQSSADSWAPILVRTNLERTYEDCCSRKPLVKDKTVMACPTCIHLGAHPRRILIVYW